MSSFFFDPLPFTLSYYTYMFQLLLFYTHVLRFPFVFAYTDLLHGIKRDLP